MANFKSIKAWQESDGFDTQATQPDGLRIETNEIV